MLASLACALTSSVPLLIGARFLQGFAGAAGIAVSRAVVRDLFSGQAIGPATSRSCSSSTASRRSSRRCSAVAS